MYSKTRSLIVFILIVAAAVTGLAQQRLLVVGGGERPADGMKTFVEWSGGAKARILFIPWATAVPDESFEAFRKSIENYPHAELTLAATRPLDAGKKAAFMAQLVNATGVFFSGGDQNRIMDVLADEELLRLVREKYSRGTPFGGTSAGAAAMSDPMMTGEADLKILNGKKVGVRRGIGFIAGIIFDQHFLVRQRHNRLFGLMLVNPGMLGIGIDEDTAVLIEDDRRLTVIGKTQVMFVDSRKGGEPFAVSFLNPGERYDLRKRKRLKK